jgi:cell division protein FtsA
MPVRLGLPQHQVKGLAEVVSNPIYSTAVGLLLHARANSQGQGKVRVLPGDMQGMLERMKSWFKGNF